MWAEPLRAFRVQRAAPPQNNKQRLSELAIKYTFRLKLTLSCLLISYDVMRLSASLCHFWQDRFYHPLLWTRLVSRPLHREPYNQQLAVNNGVLYLEYQSVHHWQWTHKAVNYFDREGECMLGGLLLLPIESKREKNHVSACTHLQL